MELNSLWIDFRWGWIYVVTQPRHKRPGLLLIPLRCFPCQVHLEAGSSQRSKRTSRSLREHASLFISSRKRSSCLEWLIKNPGPLTGSSKVICPSLNQSLWPHTARWPWLVFKKLLCFLIADPSLTLFHEWLQPGKRRGETSQIGKESFAQYSLSTTSRQMSTESLLWLEVGEVGRGRT